MMRQISALLAAHLKGDVTTLAICWQFKRRDGEVFSFTSHDRALEVDDEIFCPRTGASTAMESTIDPDADNMESVVIFDDDRITQDDLMAGIWDYAEFYVFCVNYEDLSMGKIQMISGNIGEVEIVEDQRARVEFLSLTNHLRQSIGRQYTQTCDASFGDDRCLVIVDAPIVGGEFVDTDSEHNFIEVPWDRRSVLVSEEEVAEAEAELEAGEESSLEASIITINPEDSSFLTTHTVESMEYDALRGVTKIFSSSLSSTDLSGVVVGEMARNVSVDTVVDQQTVTATIGADLYQHGVLTWVTGENKGISIEVMRGSGGTLTLFYPMRYEIKVGDQFDVTKGCDRRPDTCKTKFGNFLNFRGFPHIPGKDEGHKYTIGKAVG